MPRYIPANPERQTVSKTNHTWFISLAIFTDSVGNFGDAIHQGKERSTCTFQSPYWIIENDIDVRIIDLFVESIDLSAFLNF